MIRTHEGSSKKGKATQSTTQPSVAQKKGLKRKAPRHRKKIITLTVSEVSTKRSKNNAVVIDEFEHHDTANAMDVVLSDDGNNDKEEGGCGSAYISTSTSTSTNTSTSTSTNTSASSFFDSDDGSSGGSGTEEEEEEEEEEDFSEESYLRLLESMEGTKCVEDGVAEDVDMSAETTNTITYEKFENDRPEAPPGMVLSCVALLDVKLHNGGNAGAKNASLMRDALITGGQGDIGCDVESCVGSGGTGSILSPEWGFSFLINNQLFTLAANIQYTSEQLDLSALNISTGHHRMLMHWQTNATKCHLLGQPTVTEEYFLKQIAIFFLRLQATTKIKYKLSVHNSSSERRALKHALSRHPVGTMDSSSILHPANHGEMVDSYRSEFALQWKNARGGLGGEGNLSARLFHLVAGIEEIGKGTAGESILRFLYALCRGMYWHWAVIDSLASVFLNVLSRNKLFVSLMITKLKGMEPDALSIPRTLHRTFGFFVPSDKKKKEKREEKKKKKEKEEKEKKEKKAAEKATLAREQKEFQDMLVRIVIFYTPESIPSTIGRRTCESVGFLRAADATGVYINVLRSYFYGHTSPINTHYYNARQLPAEQRSGIGIDLVVMVEKIRAEFMHITVGHKKNNGYVHLRGGGSGGGGGGDNGDGGGGKVKYKGVDKSGNRFEARIRIDGRKQHIGTFDTSKEAAQAYDRAAIQVGRPTSTLNFLDQVPKDYKYKDITIYKGVFDAGTKFKAVLEIGKKSSYLGVFDTLKEAAIAYDLAAIQAGHPTSSLNFPQGRKSKK